MIKARVEKQGGKLAVFNAASEMLRVRRESDYLADRERLMGDRSWIEKTVHASIRKSLEGVARLADEANAQHGFKIASRAQDRTCVVRSGFVSLAIGFHQPIFNRVSDQGNDECFLRASEFSGTVLLPGEKGWVMHEPREVKRHKLKVDISETRDLIGKPDKNTVIINDQLGDHLFRLFLDLLSRANQGKVPSPSSVIRSVVTASKQG